MEEDNSLVIKRLTILDMGMFQCFARNEAGESSMSTWLKVKSEFTKFINFFNAMEYDLINVYHRKEAFN